MSINVEQRIHLNKFKPRFYQRDIIAKIENEGVKKALAVWPRRCLPGDVHVLLSNGSFRSLKDVKVGDKVLSWNGSSYEEDTVVNKWATGKKKTIKIKSHKFLPIVSSEDHLFATLSEKTQKIIWKKSSELSKYSFLMNYAGHNSATVHDPELAEFIGYMVSDGYIGGSNRPSFTNLNLDILKRVEELAVKLFSANVTWIKSGNCFTLGLNGTAKNKIEKLFKKYDQYSPKYKRDLFPILWDMDYESVKRFLAAIISGDGSLYIHKNGYTAKDTGHKVPPSIEITINCGISDSNGWGMYWLLRKFGIIPNIPYKERDSNWKIKVSNQHGILKLLKDNYIYGKDSRRQEILKIIKPNTPLRKIVNGCYLSRSDIASGNEEDTYDIETEKNHNFFANGYLVHNSGKDIVAWNILIRAALRKVGSYIYCLPVFSQARRVLLNSKLNDGSSFMDFIPKTLLAAFNQQEMKITLINGSIITMVGSNSADAIVGSNALGIVVSEAALADPLGIAYLRPIITASDGWIILISTPRSHNHFWELYNVAKRSDDWYVSYLTVEDTQHIPLEAIERDIHDGIMSKELAQQEYFCSFSSQEGGAYYGKYVDKMRLNDQITRVPYEPSLETYIFCDLGINDTTVLIWVQIAGPVVRIIDFYENNSEGLEHYVNIIKKKDYGFQKLFVPHDAKVRELSTGVSRIEKLRTLGMEVALVPKLPISDGIEAVRSMLPKTFIDSVKCENLVKALENYTKEYDERNKVYRDRPHHGRFSNANDATRYLAVSLRRISGRQTSAEELDKRYYEAVYGVPSHRTPFD